MPGPLRFSTWPSIQRRFPEEEEDAAAEEEEVEKR